ncbi:MAG TPA: EAL domain-containing protein [Geobacteraceae bacterium]
MALAVSGVFILSVAGLAYFSLAYFSREFKASLSRQQFSLVTSQADTIDDKLGIARKTLLAAAEQVPGEALADAGRAQRFLDGRVTLHALFDNGLFLFSREGRIIAESPYRKGRRGRDISFRDYYRQSLTTGRPLISSPYVSTHNPGHPAIILTAPIFDKRHRLQAIFAGSFDLLGENFLADLSRQRVGQSGYLYLFDSRRTLIFHPDQGLIMKQDAAAGGNRLFERAVAGFEGSGETVDSRGLGVLASFKRLRATDWVVAAHVPMAEAYAPLARARVYFIATIIGGTVVVLIIVWLLMHHLTAPLLTITRHVESLRSGPGGHAPIEVATGDEIGTLARAFNSMVATLDSQQRALLKSEELYRMLVENQSDLVVKTDADGRFLFVSPSFCQLFGAPEQDLLGLPFTRLVHADDLEQTEWCRRQLHRPPYSCYYEHRALTRDGVRWLGWSEKAVLDDDNRMVAAVGMGRDITDRKRAEDEIQQLAYYDTLTRLPNRALLYDRLSQAIAQAGREGRHVGVLVLDLDRFKGVNDTLGHVAGDRLLDAVAQRLAGCTQDGDTVARIGGDEFVVVLSAFSHEDDIAMAAENILALLALPVPLDKQEIFTSASIGIAVYPRDGSDVSGLLKNADIAMYQAKDQGRNNFRFFSREMNVKALEYMMLETSLRRALEREEFFLVYQPQVDLQTWRLVGMEALLRWRHPELGVLLPARFIPLAEETGLILAIGEWVLRTACVRNKAWQDAGFMPLRMAVNLSGRQLMQPGFGGKVAAILRETGLPPACLELELTESTLMTRAEENIASLGELKKMGVQLAIDDFGTGYSSLSYLKHFPIDRVKIDRAFVRDITSNADDAAIAGAIIAMSHSLNLKVTAEGVEHVEQLQFLAARQCDEIQGYLVTIPLGEEEIVPLLCGAQNIAG